ncbi:hypothetical protein AYJ57_12320 [Salipiger sp. CCB-MM3]|uniref:hypothetical protein n=1 Tax=Salipiger sp. CCB-MM3 TaxID=1792508 RepID=UPI00080AA99C|nr:hypothetical protein [Salipiger sp. CCB-MM3]ANT61081.1 hypothetical protein AYJ57_12320 [Salipiger sp. CCB-MM3]
MGCRLGHSCAARYVVIGFATPLALRQVAQPFGTTNGKQIGKRAGETSAQTLLRMNGRDE